MANTTGIGLFPIQTALTLSLSQRERGLFFHLTTPRFRLKLLRHSACRFV